MFQLDFRRTPFTLIVTALIVAIEIVSTIDPARREFFANDLRLSMLSLVWRGEYWRPLTTTLLHGDLLHAAFNVYWALIFGNVLEPYFGSYRYAGLFILLAYVSSMTSFLLGNLDTPLNGQYSGVGLSGVIYGLFALLWVGRRWRHEFWYVCDKNTVALMVGWFFLCIVLTYGGLMHIDNYGHGAGAAFGALYGLAIFHPRRRRWAVLAAILSALVIATMFACPGHPLYEKQQAIGRMFR